MHSSFFAKQYAEESNYCEHLLSELVVFNDPDDDEYEEEENRSAYYLDTELATSFWIYANVARGDVATYLKLYYETSRADVVKALAYAQTLYKLQKKQR